MYSYTIVHSLTGERRAEVTASVVSATWTTRMHSAGEGKVALRLRGTDLLDQAEWREFTAHWYNTLVVSWDGVAVYAGLIAERQWEAAEGVLTVNLVELRNEMSWRFTSDVAAYDPTQALRITDKSKRGMARAIVQSALNRGDSPNWDYPVALGVDEAGTESLEVFHYEMRLMEHLLREVQDSDGGPDVHLNPAWSDVAGSPTGALFSWLLELGTPRLPGATFGFSQSAPVSPVLNPILVEDGRRMTTGVLVAGKGSEHDMATGKGGYHMAELNLPPTQAPWRDRTVAFKSISDQASLNALGVAELRSHVYAAKLKKFRLRVGGDASPALLRLGSRVGVWTEGDEFEPENTFNGYLVGLSGSSRMDLALELVPL